MSTRPRGAIGGVIYHVLNRANSRATLFHTDADYEAFEKVLAEAKEHCPMRILACCTMPTHWHLVLWPVSDGDLSAFVHWLTVTHVKRLHAFRQTSGTGHVYQGRFKSFPVETGSHFLTVCRYVERNPVRGNLVLRAEDWRWGSVWRRARGTEEAKALLCSWPIDVPDNWLELVNQPLTTAEEDALRGCVARGAPYGSEPWRERIARLLGIERSLRPRGRPRLSR